MQPTVTPNTSIVTTTEMLPIEGNPVNGTSCKNKVWDADPTNERALDLMKNQAAQNGFDAIHSVKVAPDPAALAKNCWSAIHATGIAYKLPQEPES